MRGNPGFGTEIKFKKKYQWEQPCSAKISVRLPQPLKDKLILLPNWQEKLREAIADLIDVHDPLS